MKSYSVSPEMYSWLNLIQKYFFRARMSAKNGMKVLVHKWKRHVSNVNVYLCAKIILRMNASFKIQSQFLQMEKGRQFHGNGLAYCPTVCQLNFLPIRVWKMPQIWTLLGPTFWQRLLVHQVKRRLKVCWLQKDNPSRRCQTSWQIRQQFQRQWRSHCTPLPQLSFLLRLFGPTSLQGLAMHRVKMCLEVFLVQKDNPLPHCQTWWSRIKNQSQHHCRSHCTPLPRLILSLRLWVLLCPRLIENKFLHHPKTHRVQQM